MRIFGPFACATTFAVTTTSAGRDLRLAVAAGEEHRRRERRAVLEREAVDEQALALADAVLLAADGDDRVAHAWVF